MTNFLDELRDLLNKYSKENASDTPDYILAEYLSDCLAAWDKGIGARRNWYSEGSEHERPVTVMPSTYPENS